MNDIDSMNSFELGEAHDTDGLWSISRYGFLRANELGKLIWPSVKHNQKNGQRICRKWLDKGFVIARELPSKAGYAYVLASRGVRFLEEKDIPAKSGKDWGNMREGQWTPPFDWQHDLMANIFLVSMEVQGYKVHPKYLLRRMGGLDKIPDGICHRDGNVFVVEFENHRKTGNDMATLAKSIVNARQVFPGHDDKNLTHILAYPEDAIDERGHRIDHKTRLVNAAEKEATRDLVLDLRAIKFDRYNLISVNESAVSIKCKITPPAIEPETEEPPTEVGGFTRVAENSKSTHYAPRVENAESSQIAWSSKTQRSRKAEADRMEAGGFNPLMENKTMNTTSNTPKATAPIQLTPRAWEIRQGTRVFRVSNNEFVRSSYDFGQFTPLFGPESIDALVAHYEKCVPQNTESKVQPKG